MLQSSIAYKYMYWLLSSDMSIGMGSYDGRKDTYGVYAEPVDPEEVRKLFH